MTLATALRLQPRYDEPPRASGDARLDDAACATWQARVQLARLAARLREIAAGEHLYYADATNDLLDASRRWREVAASYEESGLIVAMWLAEITRRS